MKSLRLSYRRPTEDEAAVRVALTPLVDGEAGVAPENVGVPFPLASPTGGREACPRRRRSPRRRRQRRTGRPAVAPLGVSEALTVQSDRLDSTPAVVTASATLSCGSKVRSAPSAP